MASRSLPNHYTNISAGVDPRAPSSQRIRYGDNNYPGGQSNITSDIINNRNVNTTPGWRTNGSIRTTVQTRTRDQNYVNINQFAFMDTKIPDRPLLLNIQQLNMWLIEQAPALFHEASTLRQWIVKDKRTDKVFNLEQAEKAYIMNRFKLYGVVVNRDVDNNDAMDIERSPRAFTFTTRGVCHVLDYWSTKKKNLQAYDLCYFVLKKVLIGPDTKIQSKLTTRIHNTGAPIHGSWPALGKMCWQIVPWHTSDNYIPISAYTWVDKIAVGAKLEEGKKHIGSYWRVGNIGDSPDIAARSIFKKRQELSVAHDITYLHENGAIIPVHFYLKLDTNC